MKRRSFSTGEDMTESAHPTAYYDGDVVLREDSGYRKITTEDVLSPSQEFGVYFRGRVYWNTDTAPVFQLQLPEITS